jgi:2-haloacid dehalogenase
MSRPSVAVFDVNQTLSDMTPLGRRFADIGLSEDTANLWFTSVLRDGFALTAAGTTAQFTTLADEALRTIISGQKLTRDLDDAVDHVLNGFGDLHVHPDVPVGVRGLKSSGLRLVTLTNGSTDVADRLLRTAGLRADFEHLLSVDGAGTWKPARAAYVYAAAKCGVDIEDMLLIAAHPWDIDGAARAGMKTTWINRDNRPYPESFSPPDRTVTSLSHFVSRPIL